MNNARQLALQAIYRINEEEGYSNLVVNNLLNQSQLDKRDRSLATQLIYGTIRMRNSLDWIINQVANRKVKEMTPWVRNALRLGVYQIKFLDRIPAPAACNETVEVAKGHCNRGAVKFINGVLRNIIRKLDEIDYPDLQQQPVQHIRYKYSQPQWLVERWVKRFGKEKTIKICKSLNQVPPTVVRTNTLQVTREELLADLAAEGACAEEIDLLPEAVELTDYSAMERLTTFQEGKFQVQGFSSMLVSHVLAPTEDNLVVDLCGAPGGKATHLAQLMNNQGKVYAIDIHQHKLELIEENCERLGINNIETIRQDGREVSFKEEVDQVLIDAPCSGLGIMAKKPEIRWQKKPQDLKELQQLQLELLANAAKFLKVGGELVYSTCTFTEQENQEVIAKFLEEFTSFSVFDLTEQMVELGLEDYLSDGYLQLLPDQELLEGFFIAKLVKN
ncbi:16S rRNA (cytosine(967)-C(5))-methyltransferase RsmB [Natroniella sulfidigena]|uniref:16S rRNA (cytosine(967)-C(5))-methyltransferase RsmB n=1 Tax=Natroniella sulfidigena TaxID=723921 RepID=UPI00200AC981|nr:16S rRNA (cytosine(967)-C(5))-methyltransferase RsmB [Natroniella sulfidigena]MCK8817818.1 16S rRNA (cytosine(967)-C(5))-methyltransferase RsmB [Natroniella sulfidigena]